MYKSKLNKLDFSNTCRICITGKNYLRDIHRTKISKVIESCVLVKVSEDDGLPSKICSICFRTLTKLHVFKKKVERNDSILRSLLISKYNSSPSENVDSDSEEVEGNFNEANSITLNIKECIQIREEEENKKIEIDSIPPLIPITESETVAKVSRDLPVDAPPLVPIKPLVDLKALETVIPELEYKCYNCNEKFRNISFLIQHTLASCKPKDLQCTICLKAFNERNKLIGHLKGHMVMKNHVCNICNKKYPNASTLRIHIRSHTGEKPFKCQICAKGFVRFAGVRLHMKTHEEERPFLCDICKKTFKIPGNLERHRRIHFGIKPYCCKHCNKTYSQAENLTLHVQTCHTNERPFLCNICGKGYVNSTTLNRHMRIHSGHKPFKCSMCPKAYSNRADLRIHESYHKGKNINELKKYQCKICNMRFFHPSRLVKHKKVHDNEEKCQVCGDLFAEEEAKKLHMKNTHGFDEFIKDHFLTPTDRRETDNS